MSVVPIALLSEDFVNGQRHNRTRIANYLLNLVKSNGKGFLPGLQHLRGDGEDPTQQTVLAVRFDSNESLAPLYKQLMTLRAWNFKAEQPANQAFFNRPGPKDFDVKSYCLVGITQTRRLNQQRLKVFA